MANLSDTEIAVLMIASGFPLDPQVIAEGIGVVHAESGGDPSEQSQGPSGHIGLWAESPAFGSTKCRLNALCATKAAYNGGGSGMGWKQAKWAAWAPYEEGEAEGNGPSRAPKYIGTANSAIGQVKSHASKTTDVGFNPLSPGSWAHVAEELLHGGLLEQGPKGKALGPSGAGSEAAESVGGGILAPIVGPITVIGEVFKVIGELLFTPEGWLRIGKLIGGVVLLVWGIERLIAGSNPNKGPVSKLAKDAAVAAIVK